MTGIVVHTYPEWWLKLAGQVAHWSTDYSLIVQFFKYLSLAYYNINANDKYCKKKARIFGKRKVGSFQCLLICKLSGSDKRKF